MHAVVDVEIAACGLQAALYRVKYLGVFRSRTLLVDLGHALKLVYRCGTLIPSYTFPLDCRICCQTIRSAMISIIHMLALSFLHSTISR